MLTDSQARFNSLGVYKILNFHNRDNVNTSQRDSEQERDSSMT